MSSKYRDRELLLAKEAADFLRISVRTLTRTREARSGPAFLRIGNRILYRKIDLEEWTAHSLQHPLGVRR